MPRSKQDFSGISLSENVEFVEAGFLYKKVMDKHIGW